MKEWVVVIANAEAKIFTRDGAELNWLKNIENPNGRAHEREFFMDRPGLNFPRPRALHGGPYGLRTHDPHKRTVRERFAHQVSRYLEAEFAKKSFGQLTVLADPQMIGAVRSTIRGNLKKSNPRYLTKDLVHASTETLKQSLLSALS